MKRTGHPSQKTPGRNLMGRQSQRKPAMMQIGRQSQKKPAMKTAGQLSSQRWLVAVVMNDVGRQSLQRLVVMKPSVCQR